MFVIAMAMLPQEDSTAQDAKQRGGGSRLGGYTEPPPVNNVPDHPFNILLGRLTDSSGNSLVPSSLILAGNSGWIRVSAFGNDADAIQFLPQS